ncbi:MAG: ATP-binding protein [Anaerolineales bacterium]|jgi:hypothetical protein
MTQTWESANQRYLVLALAGVQHSLAQHSGQADLAEAYPAPDERTLDELRASMSTPPALEQLSDLFGLSPFERSVLLLCAGIELDACLAPLCAAAQGDAQRDYPTLSLALAALPDSHWSALSPAAPLRYWQLVRLEPGRGLTQARLHIDERLLHYLVGVAYLTEQLAPLLQSVSPPEGLVASQAELAHDMATTLAFAERLPLIQLVGPDSFSREQIAAAASGQLGLALYRLPAALLPADSSEVERLRRLWLRESALSRTALLLDCEESDLRQHAGLRLFLDNRQGVLILSSRERQPLSQTAVVTYEVPKPTAAEQRQLWLDGLGTLAPMLNSQIEQLVTQFDLVPPDIAAACVAAAGYQIENRPRDAVPALAGVLWQRCRVGARPRLEALAQRIETQVTWDDLILPPRQQSALQEIAMQVRQRGQVYEDWGFRRQHSRGLGITALFAGSSGTGKTLAAEVLASELRLDLYHIDLSSVVDKYIGETEKNLRQIFDAAEAGGVILLFDEADALFGKRSEVKDSHDRHANIEVSYLLQRMEQYRGLAILTSNLKDALDEAFLRRLRFVVEFPFPDAAERAAIWARVFPANTPTDGLDYARLARLNVAGGSIRNIALNATFQAAEAGAPVSMVHILQAAQREYEKLQRPLTDVETRDWVKERV